jgi:hypothetical protein
VEQKRLRPADLIEIGFPDDEDDLQLDLGLGHMPDGKGSKELEQEM